eukprot:6999589-Prymnesium_polylepis.1
MSPSCPLSGTGTWHSEGDPSRTPHAWARDGLIWLRVNSTGDPSRTRGRASLLGRRHVAAT